MKVVVVVVVVVVGVVVLVVVTVAVVVVVVVVVVVEVVEALVVFKVVGGALEFCDKKEANASVLCVSTNNRNIKN